jgi:2-methylcitrate dehydratase PrpD
VQRPDVQEMVKRINFYIDPEAESAGLDKMTSIMKITMKDGKVYTGRAEFAKGSPSNPMSYEEAADKFRGCAEFAKWPTAKTEAVIAAVKSLETLSDMSKLTPSLTS